MTDLDMARLSVWRRIRDALDEQTQALRQRLEVAKPDDILLAADVRSWSMLAHAVCDLWTSGRRLAR